MTANEAIKTKQKRFAACLCADENTSEMRTRNTKQTIKPGKGVPGEHD